MCKSGAPTLARGRAEWGQQWWQDHSSFSNSARRWGWGLTVSQSALSLRLSLRYWTLLKRACSERAYVALKIKYPEKRFRAAVLYNQIKSQTAALSDLIVSLLTCAKWIRVRWMGETNVSRVCECVSTCWTMVVNSRQSCTMLFFNNEYSVTLENGDLEEI